MADDKFSDFDLDDIIYRQATTADYEGVLAISHGLYGGRDILPAMYHSYLKDPCRVCMVASCRGQILVYAVSKIVDNGETLEGGAGRSHESVRGKGLFDTLRSRQFIDNILPKYPNIKRIRAVTAYVNKMSPSRQKIFVQGSRRATIDIAWKISLAQLNTALEIAKSKIKEYLEKYNRIVLASQNDLSDLFQDKAFQAKYIPSGILVSDSQSYRMGYKENIPLVQMDGSGVMLMSKDYHGCMESVSFGTGIEMGVAKETYRYTIDYYGESDVNLLKLHLVKHLSHIPRLFEKSSTAKDIFVNLFTLADSFDQSALRDVVGFTSRDLNLNCGIDIFSDKAQFPRAYQIILETSEPMKFIHTTKAKM